MKFFFRLIFILASVLKEVFSHEFKVGRITVLDIDPNLEDIEFDEEGMQCAIDVKVKFFVSNKDAKKLLQNSSAADLDLTAIKDKFRAAVRSYNNKHS